MQAILFACETCFVEQSFENHGAGDGSVRPGEMHVETAAAQQL
jgi:hypothetical protein